jgi:tetratricopeptide (TPR) repeat protein
MPGAISSSEEAQLAQTIEMFEVITQSQPQDYQSLEILKEAYAKLGREQDVLKTSKRIAQAYVTMGQLSSAILEYESLLQRYPNDPDVLAALGEIESKANALGSQPQLGEVAETPKAKASSPNTTVTTKKKAARQAPSEFDDGKQAMHKLFVDSKIVAASVFNDCWPTPDYNNAPTSPVGPLVQSLAEKGLNPLEKSLRIISEKSRVGFLPLEKYDIDIELARSFPAEVCYRWFILPFDRMSKSILVVTCNPFNRQAIADLEDVIKLRLIWYLSTPQDITKVMKKVFR